MYTAIKFINDKILWGPPMLILILSTGICLAVATRAAIFKNFRTVMKYTLGTLIPNKKKREKNKASDSGTISPFQAASTALAATVGTGNIIGVATAIQLGGPGAIFWMWISALLGMVIKFSEVTLSVAYRKKNESGEFVGGPMYYITDGIGKKWLAILFCIFGCISSFGIGSSVQSNSLSGCLHDAFGINVSVTGAVTAVLAAMVLIGGIKRISKVAEILVPFMSLFYILGALAVLFINLDKIPAAFSDIFHDAFTGTAASGGFLGSSMLYAMRIGTSRGIFTNEAGLGSAPIAHASASTDHPARQGLWGAFEVFFDTIIMCTITALVIITSGLWKLPDAIAPNAAARISFDISIPGSGYIVTVGMVLFAFATIIAWYYYGEKCAEFLMGRKIIILYQIVYIFSIFLGATVDITTVWETADLFNGLMALPNLAALLLLTPEIKKISVDFFKNPDKIRK